MFEEVVPGDVVLVLWTDIGEATEQFQQVVHQLQASVGGYSKHKHRIGVISISIISGSFFRLSFSYRSGSLLSRNIGDIADLSRLCLCRSWWEGVCGEHGAAVHVGLLPLHLQPRLLGLRGPGQRPAHRGHPRQPHQPPQARGPAHLPAGAVNRA